MIWEGLTIPQLEGFTGFVPPQGNGTSHVMIMGEAPGEHEAKDSIPFHPKAPAGSTFDRLLRRAGLEREKFVVCNTVWSRPPGNYLDGAKYEGEAIAAYAPFRERAFELYRPRVIVAMGGTALRALTPWGGKGAGITQCQGYILDGPWDGTFVVPALHPSAIMRGEQRMSGVVIWALQHAIEIAKHGFTRRPTRYVAHPSLEDALAFERGYDPTRHILSYDIETPESSNIDEEEVEDKDEDISYNIIRVSFCYDAGTGYAISLPWQAPFIRIATRMLASCKRARVWNGNFDNPRLRAAGAPVAGRIYDSMWAWKHLQPTLPRSLGFVAPFYNWVWEPWKNTSLAEPEVYSCKDAHALQLIGDGVDAHLKQKGQWETYERHVVELSEVLTTMSRNGLPYSAEKAKAFELELQQKWDERFSELQRIVPDELKPSKQKQGYKKVPADTSGLIRRKFKVLGQDMTLDEAVANHMDAGTPTSSLFMHEIYTVERWCKLEPFLPTSTQQVQALLKYHKLPVGKNRKTKNDSADDEHLRKMIKRTRGVKKLSALTSTLQMIRECKQLSKVLGTYVKGWRPGSDGRIHATPGFWGKMYRVSWRRPNISATIQDKTEDYIASGFRKCVATPPQRVLLESDWKGIEAVLVGWFANDPDYMRLARLGVHDYMGIHMAGGTVDLGLDDGTLKQMFRDFKRAFPKLRDDAKHTVHGPLTPDHEVLTLAGWTRIEHYDCQTPLAQWTPEGTITFAPAGLFSKHFEGDLVTLKGRGLSVEMTPDHGVPVRSFDMRTGRSWLARRAASELPNSGKLPITGLLVGGAQVDPDFIRMLVAIQADGSIHKGRVTFHFHKDRKVERLKHIAAAFPHTFRSHRGGGGYFYFPAKHMCDLVTLFDTGKTFKLDWLLSLDQECRSVFLDELPWWDGTRGRAGTQTSYLTCNRANADIVQAVAHVTNRQMLLREVPPHKSGNRKRMMYRLSFNRRTQASLESLKRGHKAYNGRVYCIANSQTGWVLVRHDNRVSIQSNTNYGMGPRLMSDMYEMPERECKRLQGMYYDLFPKVRKWQLSVLDRASRECKLTNPFTYSMPFWEVHKWDSKRQCWTLGEDAKSAIAFLPRDTAAAMLKEVLLRLRHLADEGIMLASTHDSITCEVAESDLMRIAHLLKSEMEAPVKELGNLSIGVELKAGSAWHDDSLQSLDLTEPVLAPEPRSAPEPLTQYT